MRILTDSGDSLQITPTQTRPLPPSTPETQTIPAGGYTPTQVQEMIANPPPPPLTPVHEVPAYIPATQPAPSGPGPGDVTPFRGLQGVEEASYQPAGVYLNWRAIVGAIRNDLPATSAQVKRVADSLVQVMR